MAEPSVRNVPRARVVCKRGKGPVPQIIVSLVEDILREINNPENRRGNVSIVGYPVMTYHDPAANIDINCTDIEVAFPVDGRISVGPGFEVKTIPEHKIVSVIHTGPYSGCEGAYTEAMNFIARKGLTVAGPFREIYMNSPEDVPESQLLTEIQVPIE